MSQGFFADKEIKAVRYTSPAHDNIEIEYVNPDDTTPKVWFDQIGFDDLEHPDIKSIIDGGWTPERIQKETVRYNQQESTAHKEILRHMALQEVTALEEKYVARIDQLEKAKGLDEADFVSTVINNTDDDVLFKAKLAAFELEKVQKSKAKTLKADIRGAETLIKLFGVLAKLYK